MATISTWMVMMPWVEMEIISGKYVEMEEKAKEKELLMTKQKVVLMKTKKEPPKG